jgi:hypothetical protein
MEDNPNLFPGMEAVTNAQRARTAARLQNIHGAFQETTPPVPETPKKNVFERPQKVNDAFAKMSGQ